MRIGRTIIDTDNMTIEELTIIINELCKIRSRKKTAKQLNERMISLLNDAKSAGFTFIDKDYGNVITTNDLTMCEGNWG